jgi:hypothetical protein
LAVRSVVPTCAFKPLQQSYGGTLEDPIQLLSDDDGDAV